MCQSTKIYVCIERPVRVDKFPQKPDIRGTSTGSENSAIRIVFSDLGLDGFDVVDEIGSCNYDSIRSFKIGQRFPQSTEREHLAAAKRFEGVDADDVNITLCVPVLKAVIQHECRDAKFAFCPFGGRDTISICNDNRFSEKSRGDLDRFVTGSYRISHKPLAV